MMSIRERARLEIAKGKVTIEEIANECRRPYNTMYYQLYLSKRFDEQLALTIEKFLDNRGIPASNHKECMKLTELTIDLAALMGADLNMISTYVNNAVKDGKLDSDERKHLLRIIADIRASVSDELNKIEKLIE